MRNNLNVFASINEHEPVFIATYLDWQAFIQWAIETLADDPTAAVVDLFSRGWSEELSEVHAYLKRAMGKYVPKDQKAKQVADEFLKAMESQPEMHSCHLLLRKPANE